MCLLVRLGDSRCAMTRLTCTFLGLACAFLLGLSGCAESPQSTADEPVYTRFEACPTPMTDEAGAERLRIATELLRLRDERTSTSSLADTVVFRSIVQHPDREPDERLTSSTLRRSASRAWVVRRSYSEERLLVEELDVPLSLAQEIAAYRLDFETNADSEPVSLMSRVPVDFWYSTSTRLSGVCVRSYGLTDGCLGEIRTRLDLLDGTEEENAAAEAAIRRTCKELAGSPPRVPLQYGDEVR